MKSFCYKQKRFFSLNNLNKDEKINPLMKRANQVIYFIMFHEKTFLNKYFRKENLDLLIF